MAGPSQQQAQSFRSEFEIKGSGLRKMLKKILPETAEGMGLVGSITASKKGVFKGFVQGTKEQIEEFYQFLADDSNFGPNSSHTAPVPVTEVQKHPQKLFEDEISSEESAE